jgi:hypothetical protein
MNGAGAVSADTARESASHELPPFVVPHFRAAAILNWATGVPQLIFPSLMAVVVGVPPINYPFVLRAFAGLGVVFGFVYFEISRDPLRNRNLIRWGWIAKSVSFIVVAHGYLLGEVYPFVLLFFVIEDLVWIPSFVYYDLKLRTRASSSAVTT